MNLGQKIATQVAVIKGQQGLTAQPEKTPRGYLVTLDGWRAIAVVMVMFVHSVPSNAPLFGLSQHGRYGVDIFFALSGLLITSRLLDEFRELGKFDLPGFFIRRLTRILPPAWCYLAVLAAVEATGALPWYPRGIFASLTLWRNYVGMPDHFTGHFWTLCVEEHFYLLWPLLLALLRPRLAGVAAVLGILLLAVHRHHLAHILGAGSFGMFARTDVRADALLGGCLLALALKTPPLLDRLRAVVRLPWLMPSLLAAQVYLAVMHPFAEGTFRALLWPAVLASTILRPECAFSRILESQPFRYLGRRSYSLYLWQQPFLVAFSDFHPIAAIQRFPLNWVAAFGAALIMHRLIEAPAARLGHRLAPSATAGRKL